MRLEPSEQVVRVRQRSNNHTGSTSAATIFLNGAPGLYGWRFLRILVGELELPRFSLFLLQFSVVLGNLPKVVIVLCGNLVPDLPNLVDFVITHCYHRCLESSEALSTRGKPFQVRN